LNEVEIVVTAEDRTERVFAGIRTRAKSHGDKASSEFKSGFSTGMNRGASGFFSNIAQNATGILGRAFGTATSSNPILGGGIAAIIGAGLVTAMPAIGSLAAGGLVLGFGGGIAGIGILAAAENQKVKDSFTDLKNHVKSETSRIAEPFVPMLQSIKVRFQETFNSFLPFLSGAFSKMAGPIDNFVGKAMEGLKRFQPAIGPITDAFNGLLGAIGDRLPNMAENMSDALVDLAETVEDNADSIAGLVEGLNNIVVAGIQVIDFLAEFNSKMEDSVRNTGLSTDIMTLGASALLRHQLGAEGAAQATGNLSESFRENAESASAEKRALDEMIDALKAASDWSMDLFNDQTNMEKQLRNLSGAVKENGLSFGLATEKGLANRDALSRAAKAAMELATSTDSVTGVTRVNTATLEIERDRIVKSTGATGAKRREVHRLVSELLGIPVQRQTTLKNNAAAAKLQIDNLRRAIGQLPTSKTFTYNTRITGPVSGRIALGRGGHQFERASGGIVGAASGGIRSNSILVGEHGPEIVNLPTGSMVKSNPDTRRMMSESGGGSQTILVQFDFRGAANDDLVKMIRNAIRVRGGKGDGNVQAVLG
jgi:hypothetical protein